MKWLFSVFLSLSFFLLCGYGYNHAYSSQDGKTYALKSSKYTASNNLSENIPGRFFHIYKEAKYRVLAEKIEDDNDESVNHKKHPGKSNCITACFHTQFYESSYLSLTRGIYIPQPLCNFPSKKLYIAFSVFRI